MKGGILAGLGRGIVSVLVTFTLIFACIYVFTKDAEGTTSLANKTTHALAVGFFAVTGSFSEIDDARSEVEPYVSDDAPKKAKAKS